jgi:sugar phosphate isomerase/epimerase
LLTGEQNARSEQRIERDMMTAERVALNLVTLKGEHDAKHLLHKVKTAAKAGFGGVGIWAEDTDAWLGSGKRLRDLHHAVTDQGMKVVELCEVTVCDGHGSVADRTREFAAAEGLAAPLVAVAYNNPGASLDEAKKDWTKFLDLLSDVEGVRAALHFKGDSRNLNTLDLAWDVVSAGPPSGCLLLDAYDFWRGQSPAGSLNAVPVELISMVHLSDVKNVPREKATVADRTFPGEGVMPLTYIVSTLVRRGYQGPFSVEIMGECQRRECLETAEEAFRTARKLLCTSGPSHRKLPVARSKSS